MAIVYVGGQTAGRTNASAASQVTFSLTGGTNSTPLAGDLVIVTAVTGSAAGNPAMAVTTPTGYTPLGQLNQSAVTADTSMDVSYKRMGATPDTTVTIPGTTNNAWGEAYAIQVFRGVDSVTPMDVTPVSGGNTGTGQPDPTSITPLKAGAVVVICGGGAAGTGADYTAPTNYTTNFVTATGTDTTDAMVGCGYRFWTSGAEDPGVYGGGTTGANDSWTSYTLALRPEDPESGLNETLGNPVKRSGLGLMDVASSLLLTTLAVTGGTTPVTPPPDLGTPRAVPWRPAPRFVRTIAPAAENLIVRGPVYTPRYLQRPQQPDLPANLSTTTLAPAVVETPVLPNVLPVYIRRVAPQQPDVAPNLSTGVLLEPVGRRMDTLLVPIRGPLAPISSPNLSTSTLAPVVADTPLVPGPFLDRPMARRVAQPDLPSNVALLFPASVPGTITRTLAPDPVRRARVAVLDTWPNLLTTTLAPTVVPVPVNLIRVDWPNPSRARRVQHIDVFPNHALLFPASVPGTVTRVVHDNPVRRAIVANLQTPPNRLVLLPIEAPSLSTGSVWDLPQRRVTVVEIDYFPNVVLFAPFVPPGLVIQRRPTDHPGGVGSRSADPRMVGL